MSRKHAVHTAAGICALLLLFSSPKAQKVLEWDAGYTGDYFSTLKGEFVRISTVASESDTVMGNFWFFDKHRIILNVDHPLDQRMEIDGKVILIYYPGDKRAFRITCETPVLLPIVPGLVAALKPDGGLGGLGYEMWGYRSSADTVYSFWKHPSLQDDSNRCELAHVDHSLVQVRLDMPEKQHETVIEYSDFVLVRDVRFPTSIFNRNVDGKTITTEWVYLGALEADLEIPDSIRQFRIPPEIEIEERKW